MALFGLSLVVASEGYSSLQCRASPRGGFSCCRAQAVEHVDVSSCGSQVLELRFSNWCTSLVAPRHVASF